MLPDPRPRSYRVEWLAGLPQMLCDAPDMPTAACRGQHKLFDLAACNSCDVEGLIRQLENAAEIARDARQVLQEDKCLDAGGHRLKSRSDRGWHTNRVD
jgi:hypothetical protein